MGGAVVAATPGPQGEQGLADPAFGATLQASVARASRSGRCSDGQRASRERLYRGRCATGGDAAGDRPWLVPSPVTAGRPHTARNQSTSPEFSLDGAAPYQVLCTARSAAVTASTGGKHRGEAPGTSTRGKYGGRAPMADVRQRGDAGPAAARPRKPGRRGGVNGRRDPTAAALLADPKLAHCAADGARWTIRAAAGRVGPRRCLFGATLRPLPVARTLRRLG